jgi:hypothetical protein
VWLERCALPTSFWTIASHSFCRAELLTDTYHFNLRFICNLRTTLASETHAPCDRQQAPLCMDLSLLMSCGWACSPPVFCNGWGINPTSIQAVCLILVHEGNVGVSPPEPPLDPLEHVKYSKSGRVVAN